MKAASKIGESVGVGEGMHDDDDYDDFDDSGVEELSEDERDPIEAVVLSSYWEGKIAEFEQSNPSEHPWRIFFEEDFNERFNGMIERYSASLLKEMLRLPPSPGRSKVSKGRLSELRARFLEVYASFKTAKRLYRITVRKQGLIRHKRLTLSDAIRYYLRGNEDSNRTYLKFHALYVWLFRRTERYKQWAREHYKKAEVKARRKRQRPSKAVEAERKRIEYWRKLGKPVPEKKRNRRAPKTND